MLFRNELRRAAGLLTASLFYGFSNGALFPLIALAMSRAGESDALIGMVATSYYFGAFLSTFSAGALVERLGFRRSLLLIALAGTLSAGLLLLPVTGWTWIALRLAFGYATGAFYVVADAWLGALAARETRGRMLGLNEGLRTAAMIVSPVVVVAASLDAGFVVAAAAFALIALPALVVPEPAATANLARGTISFRFILRSAPILVYNVLSGLLISVIYAMSALYAKGMGLGPEGIALFLTAQAAVGATSLALLGAVSDRLGRLATLRAAFAVGAAAAMLIAWHGAALLAVAGLAGLLVPALIVAAASVPSYSLSMTQLIDTVEPREVVQATGSALVCYTAGASIGPVAVGLAMGTFGTSGFYLYLAGVMGIGLLLSFAGNAGAR